MYNKKNKSKGSFVKMGLFLGAVAASGYGFHEWGSHLVQRVSYNVKSSVKLNTAQDEFSMAVTCHKLNKLGCKFSALSNAYNKDSKNPIIVGEYGIALTEANQHDKAILVFNKLQSITDLSLRHKASFAKSLGEKEYYNDSKEWYYKAMREQPDNLKVAEGMIEMLRKSNQFPEALSIIGNYNLSVPRTQKVWERLSMDVKNDFKAFQAKYALKEITVSKIGNHFFAPGVFANAMDMQLFIVNEDSYTTVDIDYLNNMGIQFINKGETKITAGGSEIEAIKIIIPEMTFGAWQLKNVEAMACKNCAFVAGKSIMSKLSMEKSLVANTTIDLLSMKEK
jgi:tetratricopeptide (TPR) repeat protein